MDGLKVWRLGVVRCIRDEASLHRRGDFALERADEDTGGFRLREGSGISHQVGRDAEEAPIEGLVAFERLEPRLGTLRVVLVKQGVEVMPRPLVIQGLVSIEGGDRVAELHIGFGSVFVRI